MLCVCKDEECGGWHLVPPSRLRILLSFSLNLILMNVAPPAANAFSHSATTTPEAHHPLPSEHGLTQGLREKTEVLGYGSPYVWPVFSLLSALVIAVLLNAVFSRRSSRRKQEHVAEHADRERRGLFAGGMLGNRSERFGMGGSARLIDTQSMLIDAADPHQTDPGLLKKFSQFRSYTTSYATYPSIRTFYRPHPQIDKLPSEPTLLPLLVFVHGLGGSLAQFKSVLTSLVDVAPCLGIDLPGCGRSGLSPTNWSAYTPDALAELIQVAVENNISKNQGYILVGHSLGCSLSALLASSSLQSQRQQQVNILGFVGICPVAEPPSGRRATMLKILLCIPGPIFDLWRAWDRRGGPYSKSVARFVGEEADIEVKKLQERFNARSRTPVYRRMAWGLLPHGSDSTGMVGLNTWAKLKLPVFLVAGEADVITKVDQVAKIARAMGRQDRARTGEPRGIALDGAPDLHQLETNGSLQAGDNTVQTTSAKSDTKTTMLDASRATTGGSSDSISHHTLRRQVLKTSILPSPASHGLLYDPATSRTLSGLIQPFLYEHVDKRLSLGWQLQYLSTDGKWDVKNLAKWQRVQPVSDPIGKIFRAMKTLREVDDVHSPESFAKQWRGKIKAVIDISHESPVYDPKGFDTRGIEYHKFPTVSKIPPTAEETREFAGLVEQLRSADIEGATDGLIGVHCHYGFNRTGFFICSYLIDKEHLSVQAAIDEFAAKRPPGIRHPHFLDELFVRYHVGLKRAPTM